MVRFTLGASICGALKCPALCCSLSAKGTIANPISQKKKMKLREAQ